jgi:hypothetical protein
VKSAVGVDGPALIVDGSVVVAAEQNDIVETGSWLWGNRLLTSEDGDAGMLVATRIRSQPLRVGCMTSGGAGIRLLAASATA